MLFIMVGLIIFLYALKSFKKGLIFYAAYKLILVTNITLISIPGIPMLTVETLLDILFFCLFIYRKRKVRISKITIPWQTPFLCLSVAMLLSCIFSLAGFSSEFTAYIKYLLENILFIWILWDSLEDKNDYEMLIKYITIVMFISCIYGLIEYMLQYNPLQLYEATLNHDTSKLAIFTYETTERGYRINSIYEHAIGAGMNWGLYASFIIYKIVDGDKEIPMKCFCYVTAVLCVICLFLTKMRSPIVFFAICCIGAFNFKKKRTYAFLFVLTITVGVLIPSLMNSSSDISNVILSIFNSSYQKIVGGSSSQMRSNQFEAAFEIMMQSPVFGFGSRFKSFLSSSVVSPLLGSESIWLKAMPSYGLVGVGSYIILIIYSFVKIPRYFKCKQVFFVMSAFWLTYTITSVPGFKIHLLYLFAFYYIKKSRIYKLNGNGRKTEINIKKMRISHVY